MKILAILLAFASMACQGKGWESESVDLGIEMQKQEASNWCWAATAQSITNWYGEDVTQSQIASYTFGRTCTPATCDGQNNPNKYLRSLGLGIVRFADSSMDSDQARSLIEAGKPLTVVFKHTKSGGNHITVVGGYDLDGFYVYDSAKGGEPTHVEWFDQYLDGWTVEQIGWVAD